MNPAHATHCDFVPLIMPSRAHVFQRLGAAAPVETPPPPAAPEPPTAPVPAACAAAPVITLKREGDQVTHIAIRCGCGEVIELACVY